MRLPPQLTEKVCAAKAAYLWNILPELIKLPCVEGYERLRAHLEGMLAACHEAMVNWGLPPEPSEN
jgi:hypothetical protein